MVKPKAEAGGHTVAKHSHYDSTQHEACILANVHSTKHLHTALNCHAIFLSQLQTEEYALPRTACSFMLYLSAPQHGVQVIGSQTEDG